MAQEHDRKRHLDEDLPLTTEFPRLRHPDLDTDRTEDVDEPANKDDVVVVPKEEGQVPTTSQVPEPPS